jgi:hypothetical protein
MSRRFWRSASALYTALFLLAAAAAPHQHLNGLEDLLLDQQSNSGEVARDSLAAESGRPIDANEARILAVVDDVPCLACFCSDFAAAPTNEVRVEPTFEQVASRLPDLASPTLPATERDTPSRAPPLAA